LYIFSVAAIAALKPNEAHASGYLTARFGSDHGTPAMPNGFAMYFNPAALGGTQGTQITGDLSVLLRFARYTRTVDALSPSSPDTKEDPSYVAANTGTANLTNLLALPFLGVHSDFGTQNFRAGYALYVPFGGLATWDRGEGVSGLPGSRDGVQRWHNISGQILAVYNTFAVAYRIPKTGLSIGASLSPIVHHLSTVRARNSDGSDDTEANGTVVEGRSFVDATGVNLGASAGVYYEPSDSLRLGLSYISQPGFGDTRMRGTLKTQLGALSESEDRIDFLQTYPDVIRLGASGKLSKRVELRGDVEYVRWSVFERQCVVNAGDNCDVAPDGRDLSGGRVKLNIPRNWKDAFGVRVGPSYWLNDSVELFGSVAVTTPAVPKETIDAATIDSLRFYGTLGGKFELSRKWALAASYNHIAFVPVDTKGANDQNIEAHPANKPGGGDYTVSRSPSADGKYSSQIGFVNINATYTF